MDRFKNHLLGWYGHINTDYLFRQCWSFLENPYFCRSADRSHLADEFTCGFVISVVLTALSLPILLFIPAYHAALAVIVEPPLRPAYGIKG